MPFTNFESRHFSAQEKQDIQQAVQNLRDLLKPKFANLNEEERQRLGSVNEQNKLIINKVNDYRDRRPDLASPDVDWDEFNRDYDSRNFIEGILADLNSMNGSLRNAKILHDFDVFQASLNDYRFSKYKNETSTPGFTTKVQELAQFFSKKSATVTTTDDSTDMDA